MNLQKQFLKFYLKSTALSKSMTELKTRKLVYRRLKKTGEISSVQIQDKIDEYLAIKQLEKEISRSTRSIMKRRNTLVGILKETGYPRLKNICFEHEQYGALNFWYKENNMMYFEPAE
jgi:predicted transcriptional regulator